MNKNLTVEQCIEDILTLRLSHPSHLKNVVFVFPRVKFEGEIEWSSYSQLALLGAIHRFTPNDLSTHALFVPICGIIEAETTVSTSDSKRLAQYGILSIQQRQETFGIQVPTEASPWFIPGISEDQEMSELSDQMIVAATSKIPYFVSRGHSPNSPLIGILENKSYSTGQSRGDIKRVLWLMQNKKCAACQKTISSLNDATVDHSLPKTAYGTDKANNLTVMCKPCNQQKGHQLPHDLSPDDPRFENYSLTDGLWLPPTP